MYAGHAQTACVYAFATGEASVGILTTKSSSCGQGWVSLQLRILCRSGVWLQRMLGNRVLRRLLEPKREELTRTWKKM
jgi:hypothetical protein